MKQQVIALTYLYILKSVCHTSIFGEHDHNSNVIVKCDLDRCSV